MERLHKVMARAGIASRRRCEQYILDGRVRVNDQVVDHLGAKVDSEIDRIEVDGHPVSLESKRYYFVLNKPRGYLTTVSDQFGRQTVMDLMPPGPARLYPVGRLDKDSEGLLLLTNDGDLAFRLMHPRFKIRKGYLVDLKGVPSASDLRRVQSGVVLDDGQTLPARVQVLGIKEGRTRLNMSIREGRKRQIRRMWGLLGYPVLKLVRLRFGPIRLEELRAGQWRRLSDNEVASLCEAVSLVRPLARKGSG